MTNIIRNWPARLAGAIEAEGVSPLVERVLLVAILGACAGIRLWTIQTPGLDRTCWKEIDYIEISRNFRDHGFHFFRPEVTWPAEEPRVTAMEFPLVPYVAACLYRVLGFHALSVRLVPLLSWILCSLFVFRLARRELGAVVALPACAASCLLPLAHPFGRILFSEPTVLFCSVAALYYWCRWLDSGARGDWWISSVCFSLAVAMKLEPLFLLLPLSWPLWKQRLPSRQKLKDIGLWLGVSLVLPLAWYAYAYYLSVTSLDVFGVVPFLKGHDKLQTIRMLSDPDWYRVMFDRVYEMMSGKAGFAALLLGIGVMALARIGGLFLAYLAAVIAYFCIVAEGNIDAPYRQLNLVPAASVILAVGVVAALSLIRPLAGRIRFLRGGERTSSIFAAAASLLLAAILVRGQPRVFGRDATSPVDAVRWSLAGKVKEFTTTSSRLVAIGEYSRHVGGNDLSPVLYYYTGLRGWTLEPGGPNWDRIDSLLDSLIARGATHLCVVNLPDEPAAAPLVRSLKASRPVLWQDDRSILIQLGPSAQTVTPDAVQTTRPDPQTRTAGEE